MNYSTQSDLVNQTLGLSHLNKTSQSINAVISIMTVGFNVSVALYLVLNRRRFQDAFWYQLMTFSISDGFAGVAPSLFLLTKFESINTSTVACGWIVLTFNMAQLATVLNLCQLSARRFYVLRFSTLATAHKSTPLLPVAMGIASWILSCVLVFPFLLELSPRPTIRGCASPSLFGTGDKYIAVTIYYTALLMIILLFLNIFYFITLYVLRNQWRRILPSGEARSSETVDVTWNNSTAFRNSQHRAWAHLCLIFIATNLTIWPYIVVSILIATGTIVYDPENTLIYDIHMLCLNSLLGPILNVCFVQAIRKDFKQCFSCRFG